MNVLLLRLAGPMQSWGTQSRYSVRDSGLEPSKSGVIGLVCAALGRPRCAPVHDLAGLRMGVRIDQEGNVASDYQTALNVVKAGGKHPPSGQAVVSTRYYLGDADFLVGLEGSELELLKTIDEALCNPYWPLSLGRKGFPPGVPVRIPEGIRPDTDLYQALTSFPRPHRRTDREGQLIRLVIEDNEGEASRTDQPLSSFSDRQFGPRRVKTLLYPLAPIPELKEEPCTSLSSG